MKQTRRSRSLFAALLAIALTPLVGSGQVIISQFYEGTSFDKWIELANVGSTEADLSGYVLTLWSNANTEEYKGDAGTPNTSLDLAGNTILPGQTLLVSHGSAANPTYAVADIQNNSICNFNGDDSVVLYSTNVFTAANIVDAIGFTDAGSEGANTSFVRLSSLPGWSVDPGSNVTGFTNIWQEVTTAVVDAAASNTNERLGYHFVDEAGALSVVFDSADGIRIPQGSEQAIGANVVGGDAPYTYEWTSTLASNDYSAVSNTFTVLGSAAIGTYTATVAVADSGTLATNASLTFSVEAQYPISIATVLNGTVTTAPSNQAFAGDTIIVTATPAVGYQVSTTTVTAADSSPVTLTDNTFTMPATGVTVSATFEEMPEATVWINEINYDPIGTDSNEYFEIAGPTGTDLSVYSVALYNGNNGTVYDTITLTGVLPDEGCGFGAIDFVLPSNGLQNGSPDGLAVVGPVGVMQFISYEGSFVATAGPAAGMTSADIGVFQADTNLTVQLTGTGTTYAAFSWTFAEPSQGTLNAGQEVCGGSGSTGVQISGFGDAGTTPAVAFTAEAGLNYYLVYTTNLTSITQVNPPILDQWSVAASLTNAPAGASQLVDETTAGAARYYGVLTTTEPL